MGVGGLAPDVGEARCLRAHDDGGGAGHVVVVVFVGILQLCGEDAYLVLLEEGDALLGGADGGGYAEHAADAGADEVGVVEVGQRVADDDGIDAGGLRRAEDGPEVARLLDTL